MTLGCRRRETALINQPRKGSQVRGIPYSATFHPFRIEAESLVELHMLPRNPSESVQDVSALRPIFHEISKLYSTVKMLNKNLKPLHYSSTFEVCKDKHSLGFNDESRIDQRRVSPQRP